ncbi:MAG: PD-(D/E)XK nuclease family protein [Lentisphaeria bacterium]|nr:PD-(D/E)XK nuclease family protein [Lentisphaeria bacterium]
MIKLIPLNDTAPQKLSLLESAIRKIAEKFSFKDNTPADFARTLFVLPTAEAGRLFREKAAVFFREHGGVMQLQTLLPEQLLTFNFSPDTNEIKSLEIWFDILSNAKKDYFGSGIIPDIEYSNDSLIVQAEYFSKIRENILLESGMDSIEFTASLKGNSPLKYKLEDYLILEKQYLELMGNAKDRAQLIADVFNAPQKNFKNIDHIILIECSELKNGIAVMLEKISANADVEHLLYTTSDKLCNFDSSGRPVTDRMIQQDLPFDIEKTLRMYSNPVQEAMKISSLLEADKLPASIGVLSNDSAASLTHFLARKNIEVYAPQKQKLSSFYWCRLFLALIDLLNSKISYEKVYELASDESVAHYFEMNDEITVVLSEIEKLQREHLIQDFQSLEFFVAKYNKIDNSFAASAKFCEKFALLHQKIRECDENSLPESLWDIFQQTGSCNPLVNIDINEAEISLEALKNAVIQVRKCSQNELKMVLFKHLCNTTMLNDTEQFKDDALNFSGFLDLIWYENNSLIISGITEESFASSNTEDMLFPENIRNALNWSSARSRFGADIHRFEQLLERYNNNNLFITFPISDTGGSLNTLPRLFFNVSDAKLLKNCNLLFNAELTENLPQSSGEKLQPVKYSADLSNKMPSKISVTGFKNYISCPYTFYLKNILNCIEPAEETFELQSNQMGSIIHNTLENYGKKYAENIPEIEELQNFLHSELERQFYTQTGYAVNNITVMQNEEMQKSVSAFAEAELKSRNNFCEHKIFCTEYKINIPFGTFYDRMRLTWNDLPAPDEKLRHINIVGKIDRIDLATDSSGAVECRIIDYKTAKNPVTPANAHLSRKLSSHLAPEYMQANSDAKGNPFFFADMQLIIYRLMAEFLRDDLQIPQEAKIKCGYFNLPEDITQTAVVFFDELDNNMLKKGAESLHFLMHKIFVENNFWPPSLKQPYSIAENYFPDACDADFENCEVRNA